MQNEKNEQSAPLKNTIKIKSKICKKSLFGYVLVGITLTLPFYWEIKAVRNNDEK